MLSLYPEESREFNRGEKIDHVSAQIDTWCNEIKSACGGIGTDEMKLSQVLGTKGPRERYLISLRYKELYRLSLLSEVQSETSGDYGALLNLLVQPLEDAEATVVRHATKGIGTLEKLLYPVIAGRTTEELHILKQAYLKKYQEDLGVALADDLSGDLKVFVQAILNLTPPKFNPLIHTEAKAIEIAEVIYKAGEAKWGTDEATFCNTICSIPAQFLASVDAAYTTKHGHGLFRAIQSEFSGKAKDVILYHVGMILDPIHTIADLIERTMKGIGTDEFGLSATLVRYQQLLPQVKPAYAAKYGVSLQDRITGETTGDYRQLLLYVVDTI
ncbi:Annexin (Annexin) Family [Thraustotheca clavata]|uniref:Annexin n=1 Tax=Thraustotheca clavata TaxID=74557 RepID=A0A1V9ZCN0_9STRA|nr:Annexin (Annexin) Family [Thraustotheca clavata]